MDIIRHKINNLLGSNKARLKEKLRKGTLYLQGEQVHFQAAVAQALNLKDKNSRLTFDISIDLLQSLKNKDLIYRVDYAIES